MRKQVFLLVSVFIFGLLILPAESFSQRDGRPVDNIFEKEHITNKRPIPYPSIREADIIWSKRIWRIIDLREKINLPLYYPIAPADDRYSLVGLLMHGIQYEGLPAYSTTDDEFRVRIGINEVNEVMGATTELTEVYNPDTDTYVEMEVTRDVRYDEVRQVMVKEVWFFDKNYSRMDVRILGLCPIREEVNEAGEVVRRQTFWINFPEARDLFARHEVFNPINDAQRRSFDDIFIKRYFSSYIVQESNVHQNRSIEEYAVGIEAILESQRIRDEIFTFEHDLWEW
ncbi:type IX secretion system ring subunit PorN/GldN [Alkalitalea saponilacus]|uniref:Gliding motility associated protien GldN n=1 Tax=Alkalitalea saponilacus TaxID=889453 RepID=A0A1T5HMF4_9BACT|nr:gliding motility protein GldN [Alkalitalea saponilacus]ASB49401.1 gliding motility protein GldN [Alkalitalea saponilacus]SKC21819.1 gliding motility associated protien GldN [Alkalitalea saponilacus]